MAGADLVKRNLRKLPRVAAPLEIRKLALYDLANALANVDGPHERAVVEACATGEIVGQLAALLIDTDAAQGLEEVRATNQAKGNFTLVSSSCTIRVGQRELRMDGVESRLYVLTCLVNLIYIGGGHLLYERGGAGLNILADALMEPPLAAGAAKDEAMEQRRAQMEPLLYYAVAGLFNLSDSAAFAKAVSAKPGLQQRLQQLTSSSNAEVAKYASGAIKCWKAHSAQAEDAKELTARKVATQEAALVGARAAAATKAREEAVAATEAAAVATAKADELERAMAEGGEGDNSGATGLSEGSKAVSLEIES